MNNTPNTPNGNMTEKHPQDANALLIAYWKSRALDAEKRIASFGGEIHTGRTVLDFAGMQALYDEIGRLKILCDQGSKKIDELKRDNQSLGSQVTWLRTYRTEPSDELDSLRMRLADAEACETLRAKLKRSEEAHEKTANKLADVIGERDKATSQLTNALDRVVELEQTLSIVRGDLATANNRLNTRRALPTITLPADWLDGWNEEQRSKVTLQAELGAAIHRATRAERKAAKANTELDVMRKHARVLADVVDHRELVEMDCDCKMCVEARAALDYLKQPKG